MTISVLYTDGFTVQYKDIRMVSQYSDTLILYPILEPLGTNNEPRGPIYVPDVRKIHCVTSHQK